MKEYNRQTRKWEEKSTEVVPDLKTRILCIKKQPHDYVLRVPDYYGNHINDDLTEEQVLLYYKVKDEIYEYNKNANKILEDAGVTIRRVPIFNKEARFYECKVCGRQRVDY